MYVFREQIFWATPWNSEVWLFLLFTTITINPTTTIIIIVANSHLPWPLLQAVRSQTRCWALPRCPPGWPRATMSIVLHCSSLERESEKVKQPMFMKQIWEQTFESPTGWSTWFMSVGLTTEEKWNGMWTLWWVRQNNNMFREVL